MKLYLVRHGATELNKKQLFQGWGDSGLSNEGEEQCRRLREKLPGISFDVIISSPLPRALHSAQLITGMAPEQIVVQDGLRELNFGNWEGRHFQEIMAEQPEEWAAWREDWQNYCIPEGESFQFFYHRVKTEFEKILKLYDQKNILIISHGGTLRVIAGLLLRMNPEDFWRLAFDCGCYTMFEFNRTVPVLRKFNL